MTDKKTKGEVKAERKAKKTAASPKVGGYLLVNKDKVARAKTYIASPKGKSEGLKLEDKAIVKLYDLWGGLVLKDKGDEYETMPTGYFQKEVKEVKEDK